MRCIARPQPMIALSNGLCHGAQKVHRRCPLRAIPLCGSVELEVRRVEWACSEDRKAGYVEIGVAKSGMPLFCASHLPRRFLNISSVAQCTFLLDSATEEKEV